MLLRYNIHHLHQFIILHSRRKIKLTQLLIQRQLLFFLFVHLLKHSFILLVLFSIFEIYTSKDPLLFSYICACYVLSLC